MTIIDGEDNIYSNSEDRMTSHYPISNSPAHFKFVRFHVVDLQQMDGDLLTS